MDNKTHILTIGGSGLVGSRITELLAGKYQITDMSRATGLDVTSASNVSEKIQTSDASVVILYAAKADVEGCEKDKLLGREGEAWKINVEGTRNVAEACVHTGKKLIYISTDFVFGGTEPKESGFTEDDIPSPVNWYGQTKYEGEKIVQEMKTPWIIARLSYPYRSHFEKKEYVRIFIWLLQQGKEIKAIADHIITPTFIDDIANALDQLIKQSATGIFHVTGNDHISPYDVAQGVAEEFGLPKSLISKTTRADFFKDRAPRPFSLAMNNDKIQSLGIPMRTFLEGLLEVKEQMTKIIKERE